MSVLLSIIAIFSSLIPYIGIMAIIAIIGTQFRMKYRAKIIKNIENGVYSDPKTKRKRKILGNIFLVIVLGTACIIFGFLFAVIAYYLDPSSLPVQVTGNLGFIVPIFTALIIFCLLCIFFLSRRMLQEDV